VEYIVHMIDSQGNSKIKHVEADNVKDVERKARKKYPAYEIGRISTDESQIDYYAAIKEMHKNG
jgi:hypothetical protein